VGGLLALNIFSAKQRQGSLIKESTMESISLIEWGVGGVFVAVNAYRRYNTPASNRASTTFQNFSLYFFFYLIAVLTLYVFFGAVLDSSPETIGWLYALSVGQVGSNVPLAIDQLSSPMVSALFLTTLLPSLPWLSRYDQALLNTFWDRGNIPNHVYKMAASMRRARFNFSPMQNKQLRKNCKKLNIDLTPLMTNSNHSLDFRWARVNAILSGLEEWKQDDSGRMRRFMVTKRMALNGLFKQRDEINEEFSQLKAEQLDAKVLHKIERFLDKSIAQLFLDASVMIGQAICMTELSESGRSARVTQLGFEGGTQGFDRLSPQQMLSGLFAIFITFLSLSVVEQFMKPVGARHFSGVGFMTFLMLFTYGSSLIIAFDLKRRVSMGYNELTKQRPWSAYGVVGVITVVGWFAVTISYRYILNMLDGELSSENLLHVKESIQWSFPFALQSLALAIVVSWILDKHQRLGATDRLCTYQRTLDVSISIAALALASIITYGWMAGIGPFEGYATKDPKYLSSLSFGWIVAKGTAIGAVIGWLVPMWFHINRTKSPDQIAGRLIQMNQRQLAQEIRNLSPGDLINVVAGVAASVAAIDLNVSRNEKDVYQIICGHLAGLPHSDVDIDSADKEFDHCLELIDTNTFELAPRLEKLSECSLLASLMPFIASSIAFADGVYLEQEREIVEKIKKQVRLGGGVYAYS
jgi:tellurite resistance protein